MGTYTRPNKAYGGNSYRDGDKLPAAELNADFDNLVTLANGNLDSDNISSSANIPGTAIASAADIDPSKIGDYSANSGEMKTVTSPGDSASPSSRRLLKKRSRACGTARAALSLLRSARSTWTGACLQQQAGLSPRSSGLTC